MKQRTAKIIYFFCLCVLGAVILTACVHKNDTVKSTGSKDQKKLHDDIAAENIRHVNISGNARSIVIKQSVNNNFEFYNADLDPDHKYEISCEENDDTLNINVRMENADASNNILGSVVLSIPAKELEKIETAGEFKSIYINTLSSDVFVRANNDCLVVLDLIADQLNHNITLDSSTSNTFRSVSVYLDKLPDNVKIEFHTIQDGTVEAPENLFTENRLERGSGKPVISINNTKGIAFYIE